VQVVTFGATVVANDKVWVVVAFLWMVHIYNYMVCPSLPLRLSLPYQMERRDSASGICAVMSELYLPPNFGAKQQKALAFLLF